MKILILGGTSFVGRHITEEAIKKRHTVTLFNRGKSNPSAFPELSHITGDRRKDAFKLADEEWDAVIDPSAYSPADLEPVLDNIKNAHYTFISTISVYDDFKKGPAAENSSVHMKQFDSDEVTGESYGPLKVMCEKIIEDRFKGEALIIRPGIVVGPHDPTDRFTYWAKRLNEPGAVLIPGAKHRKVQWIDARDLAQFVISQVEKKAGGVFNVTADSATMDEFVEAVRTEKPEPVWTGDEELQEQGIKPFELPFWIPISEDYPEGFILADNRKAKEAGLVLRPVNESAKDTRAWLQGEPERELKAGLRKEREQELLNRKM